ncbi:MAG TPA: hypothetical protein VGO93_22440 [Candidatus Xenobia bacterium]
MPARNSWIWPVVAIALCAAFHLGLWSADPSVAACWKMGSLQQVTGRLLLELIGPLALGALVGNRLTRTGLGAVAGTLVVAVVLGFVWWKPQ